MKPEVSYDLLELLPPIYREIGDYQQICAAEKAQFRQLAERIQLVQGNFFVQTMDEDSVSRWEQVFHIQASPSTETLELRRQRILSRLRTRPPFTLAFLHQQLDALLGVGQWTCRVDYPAYLLTIGTRVEDKTQRAELVHMVNQIKPAHIAFQMYLFCDTVKASAHAAATPCRIASRYTVRLPDFTALPDAQAQAHAAGAVEHMRKTVTIKIGGSTL